MHQAGQGDMRDFVGDWLVGPLSPVSRGYDLAAAQKASGGRQWLSSLSIDSCRTTPHYFSRNDPVALLSASSSLNRSSERLRKE